MIQLSSRGDRGLNYFFNVDCLYGTTFPLFLRVSQHSWRDPCHDIVILCGCRGVNVRAYGPCDFMGAVDEAHPSALSSDMDAVAYTSVHV